METTENRTEATAVLRYRNGTTERCSIQSEVVQEGASVRFTSSTGEQVEVPVADLKAVFLLRPDSATGQQAVPEGKQLAVEFADGEVIRGVAPDYAPQKTSFFLHPIDGSKNERILVLNHAIVSIDVERL